jgi:hypothetical protein
LLGDYERIFDAQKHQRLTEAISNVYLDIIVICTEIRKSIQEQSKSSLNRFLKPLCLDTELDDAIERFRNHKILVNEEAQTCHMIEAAKAREIIIANQELQERNHKGLLFYTLVSFYFC